MEIDFNNVRRQAIHAYNHLIDILNDNKSSYENCCVQNDEIKKPLENLRSALVGIGCCYQDNDPKCVCVLDDNLTLKTFNEEE